MRFLITRKQDSCHPSLDRAATRKDVAIGIGNADGIAARVLTDLRDRGVWLACGCRGAAADIPPQFAGAGNRTPNGLVIAPLGTGHPHYMIAIKPRAACRRRVAAGSFHIHGLTERGNCGTLALDRVEPVLPVLRVRDDHNDAADRLHWQGEQRWPRPIRFRPALIWPRA